MLRFLLRAVLLAVVPVAACSATLEPLPLAITVVPDRTSATPGEEISFELRAQGGSLLGMIIDYGDGAADSIPTFGARTARSTVRHSYAAAGVYTVEASVEDAVAGIGTATRTITIAAP